MMIFNNELVYLRTLMHLNRSYIFLLLLLCSFRCISAFSQDSIPTETIRMRQLTVDDGLSQGFVYDGLQDKDGFIWLATMDGLNRYDGYNFTVYKHDPENPYSIPENSINCIAEDNHGNLWIGTMSKGLYIMDKRTERFYPVPLASTFNKNNDYSVVKVSWQQDLLYIRTAAGMIIVRSSLTTTGNYSSEELKKRVLVLQSIPLRGDDDRTLYTSRNYFINNDYGTLEIFTAEKNHVNWTKKTLTAKDLGLGSIDPNAMFILLDSTNSLLILNQGNIYLYSFEKKLNTLLASCGENFVYGLKLIENKAYSCGYEKGMGNMLYEFDLSSKTLKKYHPENNARLLVPMLKDHTGVLWIRTDAVGVCLLNRKLQAFKTAPYIGRNVMGTKRAIVNSFTEGDSNGLLEFSPLTRQFKKLVPNTVFELKKNHSLFDFMDHRGRFWKVNSQGAPLNILLQYDTATKKLSRHDFGFKHILHVFEDHDNKLWVVHRDGPDLLDIYLSRLDKFYKTVEQAYHLPVKQVNADGRFLSGQWEDAKHILWLATDVGLFSLDPYQTDEKKLWKHWKNIPGDNSSLSADKMISLCPDPREPQRYLWLGTRAGFNRFEMVTGKSIRFSEKDGLANNVAYDIVPDDLGHLWISTNMGLSCFTLPSKEFPKGRFRNFTEEDGIAGNEFNSYTGKKLLTGEILFHGVKGTTWFNPAEVLQQQDTVPINFISLSVNNKLLQWEKDSSVINGNIAYSNQITLTHDQNIFSISFSSMDFRNEKGRLYSYRLEGFDKEWTEPSTQHTVTYTNLNPGTYTFYVRGSNTDGKWNEKGNSIRIVIVPAWYQTWLFKISMILIAAGGIYAFYRYRLRQALKLQSIRNNIASDLHDEIGSTLSSISISSAVIRKKMNDDSTEASTLLSQISTNTDNMMEAMSDIVWAVNTKNDQFENVVNRMRAFAIEILEPEDILLNMNVSPKLDHIVLNMQQRKNLYLLFKEAINNIAKYAGCKNVWVDINIHSGKIMMKIKDDGKGFSQSLPGTGNMATLGGNGLNNMQKRAKELNGKIAIDSAIGQGTEVILEFPA